MNCETDTCIKEVRRSLLKIIDGNNGVYDNRDVEKIVGNDEYLRRFLLRQNGNTKKTVEMINNVLIWRKARNIASFTDTSFSRDFYELAACFLHGEDIDGNCVLYVRGKYATFTKELKDSFQRAAYFLMCKAVEKGILAKSGQGWTLFLDLTDSSILQTDVSEFFAMMRILVNFMPFGLRRIMIVNMPWFMRPLTKIGKSILPAEWRHMIEFANNESDVHKFITEEQLPGYITCVDKPFSAAMPDGVKDFDDIDCEQIGIKNEHREMFKEIIQKLKTTK